MSAKIDAVQLQFSGHQYVAVQSMRTAGSPNANVVVPNQSKQPPPAVILTLTLISTLRLTLALILIKTTNPTQQIVKIRESAVRISLSATYWCPLNCSLSG